MKLFSLASLAVAVLCVEIARGENDIREELNSDMQKLEGTWVMVSGEQDGMPVNPEDVRDSSLVVVGDVHEVKVGNMYLKGTHTMTMTTSPKEIDAHDIYGPTKGENHGIYEFFNKDEFRVSFAATGKDRPLGFTTKPRTGQFTHVWRRIGIE